MPVSSIVLVSMAVFFIAYRTYGRFVTGQMTLDDKRRTPAVEKNDGIDFVPARKDFLLGQHFSAIAAAGPIVGPVLGAMYFGWLPVLLWIVAGSVFFGATHDLSALAGSVRHRAVSIVEMMRLYLGRTGHLLFLAFVWLSLLYVITAFTDLTSSAFVDPELGGATASSSMSYLILGILMGLSLRAKMPLRIATPLFLVLVLAAIALGPRMPLILAGVSVGPKTLWNIFLIVYCFAASLVPVWILLQPRGYLGGFFLYGTLLAGIAGVCIGGEHAAYPVFLGWVSEEGFPLFPLLFVTVACGACSGFHGIVCSGTTSKQIEKESDCRLVGYGGMLLEGVVAVLSLATVMMLSRGDIRSLGSPDRIYAEGLSRFVSHLGIPIAYARSFAMLAFATFIYDTLDVATRLARQIFQELTGWSGWIGRVASTAVTLSIPLACVSLTVTDAAGKAIPAWKLFWTVFGTSNQLLAALTLMVITFWMRSQKKRWYIAAIPMVFMLGVTACSLIAMIGRWNGLPSAVSLVLLCLALCLVAEGVRKYNLSMQKDAH